MAAARRPISLVERPLSKPLLKRYAIGEIFAPWARWKRGWVAEEAEVTRRGDLPVLAAALPVSKGVGSNHAAWGAADRARSSLRAAST